MIDTNVEDDQTWTRRKGESSKAYGLFCIYRDLGPSRRMEDLTKDNNISHDSLRQFSMKWKWVSRAEDYDDYIDENFRTKNEKRILEMRREQAQEAKQWRQDLIGLKDGFFDLESIQNANFKSPNGMAMFLKDIMVAYGQACMIEQDALGESEGNDDEGKRREEFVRLFKENEEDTANQEDAKQV